MTDQNTPKPDPLITDEEARLLAGDDQEVEWVDTMEKIGQEWIRGD
jgi:hypothetical protein